MADYSENQLSKGLRRMLYIFGLWPDSTTQSLYNIYSFILHITISLAYSICMFVNILKNINDVDHFTETLCSTLAVLSTFFKLLNYSYYKLNIIQCYKKLSEIQQNNRSNDKIFYAKLKNLTWLSLLFYCCANCSVFAAIFKTILATDFELPISSWYPFDWKHNRRDYWIVYSHNTIGAFIVGNLNVTMDCYAYYLMGMVTAQFEMLHQQIEGLGTIVKEEDETILLSEMASRPSRDNVTSAKLCLVEHQNIISLVSDIGQYFSLQFFTQICLSGITLSTSIYQLNTVSPSENIFQFAYLLAFLLSITFQTFLYTYYGNGILESSNLLSNAVYFSKWYTMLPDLGQTFIIFMERLKRKSEILAGSLFPLNLELFAKMRGDFEHLRTPLVAFEETLIFPMIFRVGAGHFSFIG